VVERSGINLKAESINRSNLNKTKNKAKKSETKDNFQKTLEKEDKNLETKKDNPNKKLEKNEKEESEKSVNQKNKTKNKEDETVQIVSFLNIKDLPEQGNNSQTSEKNLEEIKLQDNTKTSENINNIQINQDEIKTQEDLKGSKEKLILNNAKEIKGDENPKLKDLNSLNKSEKDENSKIKLEDIKAPKEGSEENKVQTLKGENSTDNEFKEELNKKLETLKENINSIDDKKEEKETTFNENLKNKIEGNKEKLNKDRIITEGLGKNTEKPVAGKENIIDQMAKTIRTGKTDSGNFIKIQLKPEVLGEMTVKLTEGKEGMIATISAEKEVVKNVLRNSGEQISTMLSEKNIKVSNVIIETNESEKQDFNLFDGTAQEEFTGEENKQGNFSNNKFSNYGEKIEAETSSIKSDEIYSGKGINFYV